VILADITPHPKHPGRYTVQLREGESVTLSLDGVERLRLASGMELDEQIVERIRREGEVQNAIDRGINLLSYRGRSERELRRRLAQDGTEKRAIDLAIEHLLQIGYLNDADYARQVARARMLGPGHSGSRVRAELARRGVAREVIDAALVEVRESGEVDEAALIERVANKKARSLASLDPPVRRRRLYAFLARRGFDADAIRGVLDRLESAP
jgi:regulatory protein